MPVKLRINELDSYQLSGHPYIERKTAYVIVNFRNQHGSFNSTSDLHKIVILDSILIAKIEPYLSFD